MANIICRELGRFDAENKPHAPLAYAVGERSQIYRDHRVLVHQPIADEEWATASKTVQTEWHDDSAPDFIKMHNGWMLSQRAFDIFKSFGCLEYCQIVELDPLLVDGSNALDMTDYWYVHVKDQIPAVDIAVSSDLELTEIAKEMGTQTSGIRDGAPFDNLNIKIRQSIVGDRHCWKDSVFIDGALFVSDALRDAWTQAGCGPIYYRQCEMVDDRIAA